MPRVLRVQSISRTEYANFMSRGRTLISGMWLYHDLEWLDVVAATLSTNLTFLGVKADNEVVLVIPIMRRKLPIFRFYGSPLVGTYCHKLPPLICSECSDKDRKQFVEALLDHIFSLNSTYFEISWGGFHEFLEDEIFDRRGFKHIPSKTSVINLSQPSETVWLKMSGRARTEIRKSYKNQLSTNFELPTDKVIDEFYSLLQGVYRRQGLAPPHPKAFYGQLAKTQIFRENSVLISVPWRKKIGAIGIFLCFDGEMILFAAASLPECARLGANSLIFWKAIEYGIAQSYQKLDLGGLGNVGIDKFKLSFGGDVSERKRFIKSNKLTLSAMNFAKNHFLSIKHAVFTKKQNAN